MTQLPEAKPPHGVERYFLKRAHGMQAAFIDPNVASVVENQARHEEVWNRRVTFTFPADNRVRHHTYEGKLFIKSYRKIKGQNRVRWSKPEDVEAGVRLADHVRESYDPKTGREIEKTKRVISTVRGLSLDFQKKGLSPVDIQQIAQKGALGLAEAGFIDAQKDMRLQIVEKIVKAASLDIKSRVNSSRSRLILSHAWVDLIRELLVGKMTENKYTSIQAKLIREREFERFVLRQVVSHIDIQSGLTTSFEDARSFLELKLFAQEYLSSRIVKLKPYARIAAISRFLIMNIGTAEEIGALRQYIGDEADMYAGTPPFTSPMLDKRARIRRLGGIKALIEEGLEIGELFLHTKTSERKEALKQYYAQKG